MDKIYVTASQVELIMDKWKEKNKDLIRCFRPYIMEGELNLDSCLTLDFKIEECNNYIEAVKRQASYKVTFKATAHLDRDLRIMDWFVYIIQDAGFTMGEIIHDYSQEEEFVKTYLKICSNSVGMPFWVDTTSTFFCICSYFFHYKQDLSRVEKKEVERHAVKGKRNTYHTKLVHKLNVEYRLVGKVRRNKVPEKRMWHVDCWNVVGHMRHYKSGKTVYIKPYKKGKDRDKQTNTLYKI